MLTLISLLVALILAMLAVASLAAIYETARQLERFEDYKKEFEERWGPLSADDLKADQPKMEMLIGGPR